MPNKFFNSRKFFVFILFVFVAGICWLLNKLSGNYLLTENYKIEFYDSKDNRKIFKTETNITAQINMNGFTAVRNNISGAKPTRVDVAKLHYQQSKINGKFYLLASDILPAAAKNMANGEKLESIAPDTIYFSHDKKLSKRLPINSNLKITLAPEYMVRGKVSLIPDSIWVSAAQSVLDSLTEINCIGGEYKNLRENVSGTLEIDRTKIKDVLLQQEKVNFEIAVIRYTENKIKVPVQIFNQPDSTNVMLFPAEVELKYRTSIEDAGNIKSNKFRVVADYNDFNQSIKGNLKVKIESMPENILSVETNPNFVEIIVTKK